MKKMTKKLLTALLTLCMALSLAPVTVRAAGVNYISEIHVTYEYIEYKAGEVPHTAASVADSDSHCTVAYEYWCEIYQPEKGGVWKGTGCYWYSDPDKMAALSPEKQITQFEAGKHYSYNIVLAAESGYFIGKDVTDVWVGEYEWGTPGNSTNLEVAEMSTKLYIYSPYSIDVPADCTDTVITGVSIINVNKNLDSSTPVTFTAQLGGDCAGKMDITEEGWEAGGSLNDVIKSTDATPRAPIAGGEYWYSIVLTAKDGYVFSEDFSDENFYIREGSGVSFELGGVSYESNFALSDDRKTLTAWEFMDPVTAKQGTPAVIDTVGIQNVTFSYSAGDAPKATATKGDQNAANYEIEYEYWEQMETNASGEAVPVAFWYSDENKNNALAQDKRITAFKEGKSYMYSISLKAKDGYAFAENCPVTINGTAIASISRSQNGLFVFAVKTIRPTKSTPTTPTPTPAAPTPTPTPAAPTPTPAAPTPTPAAPTPTPAAPTPTPAAPTPTPAAPTPVPSPDYTIIEGANSAWSQNSDGTLTFRANGEFAKFTGVKVDGNPVSADQYTAVSGSTIVTFYADYLKALSVGTHTLTVLFNDGECSTNFEVTVAQNGNGGNTNTGNGGNTNTGDTGNSTATSTETGSESAVKAPKTGDDGMDLLPWGVLLFLSGSVLAGMAVIGKRKNAAEER